MGSDKKLKKEPKDKANKKPGEEPKKESNKKWLRNRYLRIAVFFLVVILIIWYIIPPREIRATIYCPDMNSFESEKGIFNANKFSLGTVLFLDLKNLVMNKIWDVSIPSNSLQNTDTTIFENQKVKVDFDIKLEAQLNEEKIAKIKTVLSSEAKQTFNFSLYNFFRRDVKNVLAIANNDSALLAYINEIPQRIPDSLSLICFVSGMFYGDSLRIQISDINKLNSELQTKIDSLTVNYSYSCEGNLFAGGNPSALFWKATLLDYSRTTNKLVSHVGPIFDFRDIDRRKALLPDTLSLTQFIFKEENP